MNNFRVKFTTSEPVNGFLAEKVRHDFIMAGVDVGCVSDQIRKGYKTDGEITMIDLGPIVPAPEQKTWTVELYTVDPQSSNPYPSWRVKEGIISTEDHKAIEQAKAYYTAYGHTEIELIGVYEGPYDESAIQKPVR